MPWLRAFGPILMNLMSLMRKQEKRPLARNRLKARPGGLLAQSSRGSRASRVPGKAGVGTSGCLRLAGCAGGSRATLVDIRMILQ